MTRAICALVLVIVGVPGAFADGLIWQLPADGTTVEFRGDFETRMKAVLSKELPERLPPKEMEKAQYAQDLKGLYRVTVSSVGQVTRAEQKCRWIELTMRSDGNEHILKMLIPEKSLKRGEDPLDHAILTFFNPKDADKAGAPEEKGFNRIQYEIDRFRPVFPTPLKEVRQLPKRTIETPLGTFADCEVIAGTTEFDRPLRGGGRWEVKSSWQVALHADAPFGVVQIQCSSTGSEFGSQSRCDISTTTTLAITSKGNDAKSRLAGGIENRPTGLAGSTLTFLLLLKPLQKELKLSQGQIARVREIDEGLEKPSSFQEMQDPRRDENARQHLQKDLSQEQMTRLHSVALRRFGPVFGLNNLWIAERLNLTPQQRKNSAEILRKAQDEIAAASWETGMLRGIEPREKMDRVNRQVSKILEEAGQRAVELLTAGQREEYEKLKREGPESPIPCAP